MDIGKLTSTIAVLFLFILVSVITLVAYEPTILGEFGVPITIALFIGAILAAVADYAKPRIEGVIETGARLQFTPGGIASVLTDLIIVILSAVLAAQELLQPILQENYPLFVAVGVPVILAIIKILKPREPGELPENIA